MSNPIEHCRLGDAELGYSVHGSSDAHPPLVFVHGGLLRSTAGPYRELLALLADRFTVYALDLRGHGASADALAGWSLIALADDIAAFSRALGLHKPIYVGHSLSAVVGLYCELRNPGTFSAMGLLAPGPADPRNDPVDALEFLIANKHDRGAVREGFRHMFLREANEELEHMVDAVTLIDTSVLRALHAENAKTSIDDRLGEVAAPVLLVRGERDNVISPNTQQDMARKLQRCKEVVFSDEGHMFPNENAPRAAREILAFLDHDRDSLATQPMVAAAGGMSKGRSNCL